MSVKTLRRQCRHENRVEIRDGLGTTLRDYCQDCGAKWPTPVAPPHAEQSGGADV